MARVGLGLVEFGVRAGVRVEPRVGVKAVGGVGVWAGVEARFRVELGLELGLGLILGLELRLELSLGWG